MNIDHRIQTYKKALADRLAESERKGGNNVSSLARRADVSRKRFVTRIGRVSLCT